MSLLSKFVSHIAPIRHGFASNVTQTKVGLLGVPFNRGVKEPGIIGTELAPKVIRDGGLVKEIISFHENLDLKDFGDLTIDSNKIKQSAPANMYHYNTGFQSTMQRLSDKVQEIRKEERICVTIGGDHSIAVGESLIINSNSN